MNTLDSPSRHRTLFPFLMPPDRNGAPLSRGREFPGPALNLCPQQRLVPAQLRCLYLKDGQAGLSFSKGLFPFLLRLICWPPPSPRASQASGAERLSHPTPGPAAKDAL